MSIRRTEKQVRKALEALGTNAEEVAAQLRIRGICGLQYIADFCPVANYLHKELGGQRFSATVATVTRIEDKPWTKKVVSVKTTQAVRDFIGEFDSGHYPELAGLPLLDK